MVAATAGKKTAERKVPRKLHTAASHTPRRKVSAPEPTAVAMALGASVQPLMKMTASTNSRTRKMVTFIGRASCFEMSSDHIYGGLVQNRRGGAAGKCDALTY